MPADDGLEPLPASLARTWGNTETMAGRGSAGSKERTEMSDCPATREAVWEHEEDYGDIGCPICGRAAEAHPAEDAFDEQEVS